MKSLLINATNIHVGGGKRLLIEIIDHLPSNINSYVIIDSRFPVNELKNKKVSFLKVNSKGLNKVFNEIIFFRQAREFEKVLCFNNLPPMFPLKSDVYIFFQNRNIIDFRLLKKYSWKEYIKHLLLYSWFRFFLKKSYKLIVQTKTMKKSLSTLIKNKIIVKSFSPNISSDMMKRIYKPNANKDDAQYIYPADFQFHKNHFNLLKAWEKVNLVKPEKKLILTIRIDELPEKYQKIVLGSNINCIGSIDYKTLLKLYSSVDALVFPSFSESLGLPLIEAQQMGLPIFASNLSYVSDVCCGAILFDPYDPEAIARELLQEVKAVELSKYSYDNVENFLNTILESDLD